MKNEKLSNCSSQEVIEYLSELEERNKKLEKLNRTWCWIFGIEVLLDAIAFVLSVMR